MQSGNPTARYSYDSWIASRALRTRSAQLRGCESHNQLRLQHSESSNCNHFAEKDPNDRQQHTIVNGYNSNGDGTLVSVTDQAHPRHRVRTMIIADC